MERVCCSTWTDLLCFRANSECVCMSVIYLAAHHLIQRESMGPVWRELTEQRDVRVLGALAQPMSRRSLTASVRVVDKNLLMRGKTELVILKRDEEMEFRTSTHQHRMCICIPD